MLIENEALLFFGYYVTFSSSLIIHSSILCFLTFSSTPLFPLYCVYLSSISVFSLWIAASIKHQLDVSIDIYWPLTLKASVWYTDEFAVSVTSSWGSALDSTPHSKMKRERALRWSSASQLPYWKTWPHELRWEREADCVFKQFSTDVPNICVWPAIQIHKISFYISLLQNWLIINFSEVLLNVC